MFVQFTDSTKSRVGSVFGCPQDKETFPNQEEISEDDPRYLEFIQPPTPEPISAVDKLLSFLNENPDVAELIK